MAFPVQIANDDELVLGFFDVPGAYACMTGPFQGLNSTTRYIPLLHVPSNQFRMLKSTDAGLTWAEVDAGNGPMNGTNVAPKTYDFYNAVQDVTGKRIFLVHWSATNKVTVTGFDISTGQDKWLASKVSTLDYKNTSFIPVGVGGAGFVCTFRPNDNAVWMGFLAGGVDATDYANVWGAKCLVDGAGWDASLTRLTGTYQDGLAYGHGSMGCRPDGRIDFFYWETTHGLNATATANTSGVNPHFTVDSVTVNTPGAGYPSTVAVTAKNGGGTAAPGVSLTATLGAGGSISAVNVVTGGDFDSSFNPPVIGFGAGPSLYTLKHRVIKTDDTLTADQDVATAPAGGGISQISVPRYSAGAMGLTYLRQVTAAITPVSGATIHILRALTTDDLPASWEDTAPASLQDPHGATSFLYLADFVTGGGTDYVFFAADPDGSGSELDYYYLTSPGIGSAWSDPATLVGTIPEGPTLFPGGGVTAVYLGLSGTVGFSFAYGSDWGTGYWELGGAPPAPPALACPADHTAVIGEAFSAFLVASGGTPPYSNYQIVSGTLPAGLSLNAATGEISGTPTGPAGSSSWSATVDDATPLTSDPVECSTDVEAPAVAEVNIIFVGVVRFLIEDKGV